jgi:hypothetical protein
MTTAQFEAAARWWAGKLRHCRQSGLSAAERGRPENRAYEIAEMLMTINRPTVSDEQIERFTSALVENLETANQRDRQCLGVDYHPDRVLEEALVTVGITANMGTLPIKTMMWLRDDGSVAVRYGYGADIEVIYAPPESAAPPDQETPYRKP